MSSKTSPTTFVDVSNARFDDQRQIMEEIVAAGHCPFCPENFGKYNKHPYLKDGQHWFLTNNKWPYRNTKNHFILITKQHAESFAELSDAARAEVFELAAWAIDKYKIPGGALCLRFGDSNHSAGSVAHLHAQLIHPDIDAENYEEKPVRLRIGKARKK
jgi:ATP adenylyltransferase